MTKARSLAVTLTAADQVIHTPMAWTAFKNGAVPHLTPETLATISDGREASSPKLVPLSSAIKAADVVKAHGKGLAAFVGLPESPILMTVQDPHTPDRKGYHQNKDVSVWTSDGNRHHVTPAKYMEAVSACRPDAFVALCDGETDQDSSAKRMAKAVSKSLDFLDRCVATKENDPSLSDSLVFGAVQGGYDLAKREFSATATAERPVDGFLIDGLHANGAASVDADPEAVKDVLKKVVPLLHSKCPAKPLLYLGSSDPCRVLDLVDLGVDMFDSTYAHHAVEDGKALVFRNTLDKGANEAVPGSDFTLDLKQESFKEDFSPISSCCSCYSCRKHTRAYVNHLLATNEMLGPVLLMMHNVHHYSVFFETVRKCVADGNLADLRRVISPPSEN